MSARKRIQPSEVTSLQKMLVAIVAFGLMAIFMTLLVNGTGIPDGRQDATRTAANDSQSNIAALMARLKDNPTDVEALQEIAESFSRNEEWDKAVQFWSKVMAITPKDANALNHRGMALLQAERYQDAIADFEQIVTLDAGAYHALYYLGMIYKYEIKDAGKAKTYFQRVLDAKPEEKDAIKAIRKEMDSI